MCVGNKQRQAEAAQQALRRAFPVAFFFAHLEKLAGERDVRLRRQIERPAERGAHGDLLGRDVVAPGLEALDLGHERIVFLLAPAKAHGAFGEIVLQARVARAEVFGDVRETLPLHEKLRIVPGRALADGPDELGVAPGLALARFAFLLEPPDLRRQPLQPVAALLRDGTSQLVHLPALAVAPLLAASNPGVLPGPVLAEPCDTLVQQFKLERREPGPQRLPARSQLFDLRDELGMALAVGDERRQQIDLALRLQHGLVGTVQIVEVVDQGHNPRRHLERLQHVSAHELGEVAHRLHGDRLMEELQRLLVVDPETAAEPGAIGREAVEQIDPRVAAQPLSQPGDVGAEARELAGDGQRALGSHEESRRLTLRFRNPEHLGQGHGLLVAGVVKHPQDDRETVVVTERDGTGRAAHLVAFGFVVAEDV